MDRGDSVSSRLPGALASARPAAPWRLPAGPAGAVLAVGAVVAVGLIALAAIDVAGLAVLWENLHWNVTGIAATVAAALAFRGAQGRARVVRGAWLVALAMWELATLAWSLMTLAGAVSFPSVMDALVLSMAVPGLVALVASVRGRLTSAEESAVYLDTGLVVTFLAAILLLASSQQALAVGGVVGVIAMGYPILFFGLAGATFVGLMAIREPIRLSGGYALMAGQLAIGLAFALWFVPAATGPSMAGSAGGVLFSVGALLLGLGAATWSTEADPSPRFRRVTEAVSRAIAPVVASALLVFFLTTNSEWGTLPIDAILFIAGGLFVSREAFLLRERSVMLDEVRVLHDENAALVDELRDELEERARVQGRMIEASRAAAVGQLASGIAHQVNNPLGGILGYAELLLADLEPGDPRRADVQVIRDEALRARTIVWALRDFARPAGQQWVETDLRGIVERTLELVRYPLEGGGVIIEESHGELPPVELDPQAIQQVVLNVLTNAMQAMPAGGRLVVRTSGDEGQAVIGIGDDGVGMDDDVAARAFEPFYSARAEPRSIGLGLSVAREAVERHGGTIVLQSAPGAGTTVEIRLPLTRRSSGQEAGDIASEAAGPSEASA